MKSAKFNDAFSCSVVRICCLIAFSCVALPGTLIAQSLPSPWTAKNIGDSAIAGSATFSRGTFTITAADATNLPTPGSSTAADPLTFVYRPLAGDGAIVARLSALHTANPRARAGVMLRDSLDAESLHAFAFVSADGRFGFERQAAAGGARIQPGASSGTLVWLKLERRGSMITAFGSGDGTTWSPLGTEIIPMHSSVYVGVAASGGDAALSTTADLAAVSVTEAIAARANSTLKSDVLQASAAPAGWSSTDIGLPLVAGMEQENNGVFAVTGGGTGIGGVADQFHYLYKQFSGDIDVVARVNSVQFINAGSEGGIMIRDSLTTNAAHASMFMTAGNGPAFVRRPAAGGFSSSTSGGTAGAPYWLKLQLRGGSVTALESVDGLSWTTIGSVNLLLPSTYFVGMAVTGGDALSASTALIDNVAMGLPNQAPAASLTAPANGATFSAPATVTLSANASDTDGTVAKVDFFAGSTLIGTDTTSPYSVTWSNVAGGSYSLTAVATDNDGATTTSVARTITVNSPPAVSLTAPANGATFAAPATITVSANASDTDGTVARVDFFAGTTLIGSDTTNPFSITWSSAPAGNYSMTAVATDDDGETTTSAARSITVTPPNQPPTASLTAPANGATFTAPATITVSANASDPDGNVARVDFFVGTTLIGSDTASPYSVNWSNVVAGTYSLTAVATDDDGATTTSAARTVTVTSPNQAPTVSLTAPADNTTFSDPATVTITAAASDVDGAISKVEFFAGSTLIGTDTTSPYSINWNNPTDGTYALTAVATDNSGVSTTSSARSIHVRTLPVPWQDSDIGSPSAAGSARYSSGTFTIDGRGNLWVTPDQFHYVYQPFSGDVTITAHVASMENTNGWAKAAVMIRESLAADAADAVMALTPANGANFFYRPTTGAASHEPVSVGSGSWLRLERRGTTVTGYQSTDGTTWTVVGSTTLATSSMLVGLAASSDDPNVTATHLLDNVVVSSPLPNQPPTVALTAPANGAMFTAPATITVSATASDSDGTIAKVDFFAGSTLIGTDTTSPYSITWSNAAAGTYTVVAVATDNDGDSTTSAGATVTVSSANQAPTVSLTAPANGATFTAPATMTVSGNASDSDGSVAKVDFFAGATLIGTDTTSPYSITWSNVPAGSYSLTAVATDDDGATTTSAARTITVSAAANQAPTVSLSAPANGASFAAPATVTVSATAADADGAVAKVDFFAGATLIGTDTTSPYSITWSNVAAGSYSLTAVATDDDGATTTSAARTITVTGGVPAPWQSADIGSPSAAGNTQYANGTFTVDARGNLWSTPDTFRYVYQSFNGDITITAHVVSMENTNAWAKAGVMIRETLAANSADAVMALTPGNGAVFFDRPTAGASSQEPVSVGSGTWVRLQRVGTTITGYQSTNGTTWTAVGSMTLSTASMFVGLAASSDDPAVTATHVFDNVVVSTPTANQPPTVSLTAPANGATFTAPATITVSATASDTDGAIAKVDFFAGSTLIGTDTTSPYSITWNNVAAGSYSLTAVATDDDGTTTTSAARTITVSGAANQPPTASLTAPANGATFTAPATVTVSAAASDTDGTIAKVDFFAGSTLIGTDTTSPYSITWNNVAAGSYSLTAVATDNDGATTTSAARTITVSGAANQPPTTSLTAPANGATFTAPATITVSANASDTDGTIAKVDFFAGSTLIGTDTTSPYSITWSNVGAGSYTLTAVATDNDGATTTSAARTITVSAGSTTTSAVFTASADHATLVTHYVLDIFASGANPNTATPIASQDLGKPAVVSGDCTADITQTFNALAAGNYIATVSAVGNGGSSRSTATAFTR